MVDRDPFFAQASFFQMLDKLDPINADEFRKCLRFLKCIVAWFDLMGVRINVDRVKILEDKALPVLDANTSPPLSAATAEQVSAETMDAILSEMSDEEKQQVVDASNAYASLMVSLAPPDIRKQFALHVAQKWAEDSL